MKIINQRKSSGQSIVEFLVAASFVLVPMLLLTTYLGKVGDMEHRAMEASRYSTWETAKTGKSAVQIQNEINKRILYKGYRELDSSTDGQSNNLDVSKVDPLYFHSGNNGSYETFIAEDDNSFNKATASNEAPESNLYNTRVTVARAGPTRIDVSGNGLITGAVEFTVSTTKWLENMALSQRTHNTLLAETWRAPTHGQVEDSIDGAILARSSFLSGGMLAMGTQLATLIGLQEWSELDPGHVEHDVVPCGRLVSGGNSEDACH